MFQKSNLYESYWAREIQRQRAIRKQQSVVAVRYYEEVEGEWGGGRGDSLSLFNRAREGG